MNLYKGQQLVITVDEYENYHLLCMLKVTQDFNLNFRKQQYLEVNPINHSDWGFDVADFIFHLVKEGKVKILAEFKELNICPFDSGVSLSDLRAV